MALATYSDLLANVATWLSRSDLTSSIPDFVTLAEARIAYGSAQDSQLPSRPLRIRGMETSVPLVLDAVEVATNVDGSANAITCNVPSAPTAYFVGFIFSFIAVSTNTGATTINVQSLGVKSIKVDAPGAALVGGEIVAGGTFNVYYDGVNFILMPGAAHVPLPSNYLAMRTIYVDVNPRAYLDYLTPDTMNRLYPLGTTGVPRSFTIEGDAIRFAPAPSQVFYCWVNYYQKFPSLAASSTNWLLQNAPGVYLYATLLESAPFIGMDDRLSVWHGLYRAACDGLQEQDERDRHSGALLTMRPQHAMP